MNSQNEARKTRTKAPRRPRARARTHRVARLAARAKAGMTIIEIMVVVIIMGLIMSAAGIAIFNQLKRARIRTTEQAISQIQAAVRLYQNEHPDACPTVQQLQQAGDLDRSKATTDAWGHQFRIECEGGEVSVRSDGPDGRQGTDDDLPAQQQNQAQGG